MGLPHSNARLTKITRPGTADDWDEAAGAGPTLWEGDSDAYVRDTRRFETTGERSDLIPVRLITLPAEVACSVGDTLYLTWNGQDLVLPVRAVTTHAAPSGVPGESVAEAEPT